ncbi:MAG: hypothetical protein WCS70_01060 [Verrucomicrobiota bacterium]
MKRFIPLLAVILTGCVIHSIEPFYSSTARVAPNAVLGRWQLLQNHGEPVGSNNISPWIIETGDANHYKLTAYDSRNVGAPFDLIFFTVGKSFFVDVVAGLDGGDMRLNEHWTFAAVHPVHSVCKVILETNRLQLIALDYQWVEDGLTKKQLALPHYGTTNDLMLFTTKPADWETFLQKYANDAGAFPEKRAFELKRIPETKTP